MKKLIFVGLFALLILVQIPQIFSLSSKICRNVSQEYKSDCREILQLDLSDEDKIFLINHLGESYSVFDVPNYQGLFSNNPPVINEDHFNYNPKENINKKFVLIFSIIILFLLNYILYKILKKYYRRIL